MEAGAHENQDIKKEVIGGYVLFPGAGTEQQIRATTLYKSIDKVNIGALPLRPGYEVGRKFLCDFIKGLVNKSTQEQLVGMKSQSLKGTVQALEDAKNIGSLASLFTDAAVMDHLSEGMIKLIQKQKFYVRGKLTKDINPEKVQWAFVFVGSSDMLSLVLKLEYVRTVASLEELKNYGSDGLNYGSIPKNYYSGELYIWRVAEIIDRI